MYISLTGEPGKDRHDYQSTNWGKLADVVKFSCDGCTVNIAVYGFKAGTFTITATTNSITQLQAGHTVFGTVDKSVYRYYSFYNIDPFAILSFTLTTISGDGDLYIKKHLNGTLLALPTSTSFEWRSIHVGADTININYYDDRATFCTNCEYIVGIYGYKNTSFSLLITDTPDATIRLSNNIPQVFSAASVHGTVQYFSAMTSTSADDLLVTITPLDTGSADLYIQVYNSSYYASAKASNTLILPTPSDPRSYVATTASTVSMVVVNFITIPGPHPDKTIFVIGVVAQSGRQFSIVARTSQTPITLLAGIPQNHFVTAGKMEYFQFTPSEKENVRISVSSRVGDPDLFVGTGKYIPHCPPGSTAYNVCRNATWISRQYATDQILLSKDEPCSAVIGTTILISNICDPRTAFLPGTGQSINIGVLGYSDSEFTITITPSGLLTKLSTGQTQLSVAEPNVICTQRSADTETCLPTNTKNQVTKTVLISTFSFLVSSHTMEDLGDTLFTLSPETDSCHSDAYGLCTPGCTCNPLRMYVNVCDAKSCTTQDRNPSSLPGTYQYNVTAATYREGHSYVSSSYTLEVPTSGGKCDPSSTSTGCMYYIAVVANYDKYSSSSTSKKGASTVEFSLAARTQLNTIMIPCASSDPPDGILHTSTHALTSAVNTQRYEICGTPSTHTIASESLVVSLEQCVGESRIYACADDGHCASVVPTSTEWAYYADTINTCTWIWGKKPTGTWGWTQKNCQPTLESPQITVEERHTGNYFLMANGSTGEYSLRIEKTLNRQRKAPKLTTKGSVMTCLNCNKGKLDLNWPQSQVMFAGATDKYGTMNMLYTLYLIDRDAYIKNGCKAVLSTPCGLERAVSLCSESIRTILLPQQNGGKFDVSSNITHSLSLNLFPRDKQLSLILVATCDAECLREISKDPLLVNAYDHSISGTRELAWAAATCNQAVDCSPQHLVYSPVPVTVSSSLPNDSTAGAGSTTHHHHVFFVLGIIVLILVAATIALGVYYFRSNRLTSDDMALSTTVSQGMQLREFTKPSSSTSSNSGSGAGIGGFHYESTITPVRVRGSEDDKDRDTPHSNTQLLYTPPSMTDSLRTSSVALLSTIGSAATKVTDKVMQVGGNGNKRSANPLGQLSASGAIYSPLYSGNGVGATNQGNDFDDDEETVVKL